MTMEKEEDKVKMPALSNPAGCTCMSPSDPDDTCVAHHPELLRIRQTLKIIPDGAAVLLSKVMAELKVSEPESKYFLEQAFRAVAVIEKVAALSKMRV